MKGLRRKGREENVQAKEQSKEQPQVRQQKGSTPAESAYGWKIPMCYILWAGFNILFMGFISLCLGRQDFISGETGKNIVEAFSSLLGSIYISFLLGRWKEKEWKLKRTTEEIKINFISGMALFICRIISRLVFSLFPEGIKSIGYFTVLIIDLVCMILIYSQLPSGIRKEEGEDA